MASPSTLIKFDVCLYKKDEVSYEDFAEWATKVYPVKAKPVIQKYTVKWTQTVNPPHFREPLRHALKTDMGRPGWSIPDYDMVTTYWLHSLDDLGVMTSTPEWAELEVGAQAITPWTRVTLSSATKSCTLRATRQPQVQELQQMLPAHEVMSTLPHVKLAE